MSDVDERIVKILMENDQFEDSAKATLTTLDKLNKSLELSNASKGFNDIEAASKKVNLQSVQDSLDQLNNRFSALGIMGMTALNNIANTAINTGKRIVESLTIDPIKTGLSEYELKLDSIQVIMSNTNGVNSLDEVKDTLEQLNRYADKTIYNFGQMTDNVGKFTAAGIGLEDSVTAITGLSNLSAMVGANAVQNSRAMYNLSQALSVGKMQLLDWRSFENAGGLGGEIFRNELIKTAESLGYFNKEWETNTGQVINGADLFAEANQTFRETLKYGWVDNEVLIQTLAKFADETTDLGQKAYKAATEVRTLSKMMDALKEAAQSGWAESWELIIGDFEEAPKFLTQVNNIISSILDKSAQTRKSNLQLWHDDGGRDKFLYGILNILGAFEKLFNKVMYGAKVVGSHSTLAQNLTSLSQVFYNFSEKIKAFVDDERLIGVFLGIYSAIDIIKQALSAVWRAASPIFEAIMRPFDTILTSLDKLGLKILSVSDNLFLNDAFFKTLKPIGEAIASVMNTIIDLVFKAKAAAKSAIDFIETTSIVDIFSNIKRVLGEGFSYVTKFVSSLKDLEIVKDVSRFFDNAKEKLDALASGNIADGALKKIFERIKGISEAAASWHFPTGIFDTAREGMNAVYTFAKGIVSDIGGMFKKPLDTLMTKFSEIGPIAGKNFDKLKSNVTQIATVVSEKVGAVTKQIKYIVSDWAEMFGGALSFIVEHIMDFVKWLLEINASGQFATRFFSAISTAIETAASILSKFTRMLKFAIISLQQTEVFKELSEIIGGIRDKVGSLLSLGIEKVVGWFEKIVNKFKEWKMPQLNFGEINTKLDKIYGKIKNFVKNSILSVTELFTDIKERFLKFLETFKIKENLGKAWEAITDKLRAFVDFASSVKDKLASVKITLPKISGSEIIDSIRDKIQIVIDAFGKAKTAIGNFFSSLKTAKTPKELLDTVKSFASSTFKKLGENLKDAASRGKDFISTFVSSSSKKASEFFSQLKDTTVFQSVAGFFEKAKVKAIEFFKFIVEKIKNFTDFKISLPKIDTSKIQDAFKNFKITLPKINGTEILDTLKDKADSILDAISRAKNAFGNFFATLKTAKSPTEFLDMIKTFASTFADNIGNNFEKISNKVKAFASTVSGEVYNKLKTFFDYIKGTEAFGAISNFVDKAKSKVKDLVDSALTKIREITGADIKFPEISFDKIKESFQKIIEWITGKFEAFKSSVESVFNKISQNAALKAFFDTFKTGAGAAFAGATSIFSGVVTAVQNLFTTLGEDGPDKLSKIADAFKSLKEKIVDFLSIFSKGKKGDSASIDSILGVDGSNGSEVAEEKIGILERFANTLKNIKDTFLEYTSNGSDAVTAGAAVVADFVSGLDPTIITNAIDTIWAAIKSKIVVVFDNIKEKVKELIPTLFKMANAVIAISALSSITSISGVLSGIKSMLKSYALEIKANALIKVAGAIAIFAGSIILLGSVPPKAIDAGVAAMTQILLLLGAFVSVLEIIKKIKIGSLAEATGGGEDDDKKGIGAFLNKISGSVKKFLNAASMAAFSAAIILFVKAIKECINLVNNTDWVDLLGAAALISVFIANLKLASMAMKGMDPKAGAGAIGFAAALVILTGAVGILGSMDFVGTVLPGTMALTGILLALTGLLNGVEIKDMSGIIQFATAMNILSIAVGVLGLLPIPVLLQGGVAVLAFITSMTAASKLAKGENFEDLGAGISKIATGLSLLVAVTALFGDWTVVGEIAALSVSLIAVGGAIRLAGDNFNSAKGMSVVLISLGAAFTMFASGIQIIEGAGIGTIIASFAGIAGVLIATTAALKLANSDIRDALPLMATIGTIAVAFIALSNSIAVLKDVDPAVIGVSLGGLSVGVIAIGTAMRIAGDNMLGAAGLSVTIMAVAAAFALIVSACKDLPEAADGIGTFVKNAKNKVKDFFKNVVDKITSFSPSKALSDAFSKVNPLSGLSALWDSVKDVGKKLIEALLGGFFGHTVSAAEAESGVEIPGVKSSIFKSIAAIPRGIGEWLSGLAECGRQLISSFIGGIFGKNKASDDEIQNGGILSSVANTFSNSISSIPSTIGKTLGQVWESGKKLLSNMLGGLLGKKEASDTELTSGGTITPINDTVSRTIDNIPSAIGAGAKSLFSTGSELLKNLLKGLLFKSDVSNAEMSGGGIISAIGSTFSSTLSGLPGIVGSTVKNLWNVGKSMLGNLLGGFLGKGEASDAELSDGGSIDAFGSTISSTVSNLPTKIGSAIKGLWETGKSMLSNFLGGFLGKSEGEGVSSGETSNGGIISSLGSSILETIKNIPSKIGSALKGLWETGKSIVSKFLGGFLGRGETEGATDSEISEGGEVKSLGASILETIKNIPSMIGNALRGLWEAGKSAVSKFIGGFLGKGETEAATDSEISEGGEVKSLGASILETIKNIPSLIGEGLRKLWEAGKSAVSKFLAGFLGKTETEGATDSEISDGGKVKSLGASIIETIKNIPSAIAGALKSLWEAGKSAISKFVGGFLGKSETENVGDDEIKSGGEINSIAGAIKSTIASIPTKIAGGLKSLWDAGKSMLNNVLAGLLGKKEGESVSSNEIIPGIADLFVDTLKKIPEKLKDLWEGIKSIGSNLLSNVKEGVGIDSEGNISGLIDGFVDTIKNIPSKVKSFFTDIASLGGDILHSLLSGIFGHTVSAAELDGEEGKAIKPVTNSFIKTLTELPGAVGSYMGEMIAVGKDAIVSFFKGLFGVNSVSDSEAKNGKAIASVGESFSKTLKNLPSTIGKVAKSIVQAGKDLIVNFFKGLFNSNSTPSDSDIKGTTPIDSITDTVATTVKNIGPAIKNVFSFLVDAGKSILKGIFEGLFGSAPSDGEIDGKTSINSISDTVGTTIKNLPSAIASFLSNAVDVGKAIIKGIFKGILGKEPGEDITGSEIIDSIGSVLVNTITGLPSAIFNALSSAFSVGKKIISMIIGGILGKNEPSESEISGEGTAESVNNIVSNTISGLPSSIGQSIWEGIKGLGSQLIDWLVSGIAEGAGSVVRTVSSIIEAAFSGPEGFENGYFDLGDGYMVTPDGNVINKAELYGEQISEGVARGVSNKKDVVEGAVTDVTYSAMNMTADKYNRIRGVGEAFTEVYGQGIGSYDAKMRVRNSADEVAGYAVNGAGSRNGLYNYNGAYGVGMNFSSGFAAGIRDFAYLAIQDAERMANASVHILENRLVVQSPSKVTTKIGQYFSMGFSNGIKNYAPKVDDSVNFIGALAVGTLNESLAYLSSEEYSPVVTPVLDMTQFEQDANRLSGVFGKDGLSGKITNESINQTSSDLVSHINFSDLSSFGEYIRSLKGEMVGLKNEMGLMRQNAMNQADTVDTIRRQVDSYLPQLANMRVSLDSGTLVGELTPQISSEMAAISNRRR